MDSALQLILQGGAFSLLAYIVFWVTRDGAPKAWAAGERIARSIDANTTKLGDVEKIQTQQTRLLIRLVENQKMVGEETLTVVKDLKGKADRPNL